MLLAGLAPALALRGCAPPRPWTGSCRRRRTGSRSAPGRARPHVAVGGWRRRRGTTRRTSPSRRLAQSAARTARSSPRMPARGAARRGRAGAQEDDQDGCKAACLHRPASREGGSFSSDRHDNRHRCLRDRLIVSCSGYAWPMLYLASQSPRRRELLAPARRRSRLLEVDVAEAAPARRTAAGLCQPRRAREGRRRPAAGDVGARARWCSGPTPKWCSATWCTASRPTPPMRRACCASCPGARTAWSPRSG